MYYEAYVISKAKEQALLYHGSDQMKALEGYEGARITIKVLRADGVVLIYERAPGVDAPLAVWKREYFVAGKATDPATLPDVDSALQKMFGTAVFGGDPK